MERYLHPGLMVGTWSESLENLGDIKVAQDPYAALSHTYHFQRFFEFFEALRITPPRAVVSCNIKWFSGNNVKLNPDYFTICLSCLCSVAIIVSFTKIMTPPPTVSAPLSSQKKLMYSLKDSQMGFPGEGKGGAV